MPLRKPSHKRLRSLCAEVHPDDGADPRYFFRAGTPATQPAHKARRLCHQVAEILDGLFAAHPADDSLRDLAIVAVDPAPDTSHILVTVALRPGSSPIAPQETLRQLARASGWLRSEVAVAIRRKRAPLLTYRTVQGMDPTSIQAP